MQTASQGLADNAVHGAGHFASEDVATLSNRKVNTENPGFFHKVGNVLKEMGNILRRSIGYRTEEEVVALQIAMFENEASHALDFIIKEGDMKDASEEALKAFGHKNSERLIDFSMPVLNDIFFNALEKKFNSLNSISTKQNFIANLEKVIPHIKLDKPESFASEEEKALFKQREVCTEEFLKDLADFCHLNKSGTGLHSKLNEWITHYKKIQALDKINHPLIKELQAHESMRLTDDEKKALDLTQEKTPKLYDIQLTQKLKVKLGQSTIEASKKAKYEEALNYAESTYEKLKDSSFKFTQEDLQELKPYLTDDEAINHVRGIIFQRIQKESDTQVPNQQLVETHYKSFEAFLKRYQSDFENHTDSDLKLSDSEKESLKRLLKNFDTSKPLGTETLSQIISGFGMEKETAKNIATGITQFAHNQAKSWAVNSVLGNMLRPVMGHRATGFVTTATLSSLSGMRPGEALRHTGTSFVVDHCANRVLEGKHPAFSMGWGFFGRGVVISKIHSLLGNIGLRKVDDSISASFSRFWQGLKTW